MADLTEKQLDWTRRLVDERLDGLAAYDWLVVLGRDAERRESLGDALEHVADARDVPVAVVCCPWHCRVQVARPRDMASHGWHSERYSDRGEDTGPRAWLAQQTLKRGLEVNRLHVRDGDVVLCRSPEPKQREQLRDGVAGICQRWDLDALAVSLGAAQGLKDLPSEALEAFGWRREEVEA